MGAPGQGPRPSAHLPAGARSWAQGRCWILSAPGWPSPAQCTQIPWGQQGPRPSDRPPRSRCQADNAWQPGPRAPGQGWVVPPLPRPSWVRRTLTCHSAVALTRFEATAHSGHANSSDRPHSACPPQRPTGSGPTRGSLNRLWHLPSPGPQSGAPGLKGSPSPSHERRVGTTQGWELAEAPRRPEQASCGHLSLRPRPKGNSGWFRVESGSDGRSSHPHKYRFNPVQQGLGGLRMDPRLDSPAATAGRGSREAGPGPSEGPALALPSSCPTTWLDLGGR